VESIKNTEQVTANMVSSVEDLKSRGLWIALLAELLGTLLLVLVGSGSCLYQGGIIVISLCFGFSVATIVYAIGNVSGGHINPAVTVGFLAARRITLIRAMLYVVAQVIGAVLGATLLKLSTPEAFQANLGSPTLAQGLTTDKGFAVEMIITFTLVLTVFAACDNQRDNCAPVPLSIGLAIAMCHLWAVPVTGSGMNPARVFGPNLVSGFWDNQWLYWLGPLAGAALAGLLYDLVFAVNATPSKMAGFFTPSYDNDNYDKNGKVGGDDTIPLESGENKPESYGSTSDNP